MDVSHAIKDGFVDDAYIVLNAGQEPMNHNKVSVGHHRPRLRVPRKAQACNWGGTMNPTHLRNILRLNALYEIQSATEINGCTCS